MLLDPPEPAATGALALPFVSAMSVFVPSLEAVLPVLTAPGVALPEVFCVGLLVPEPVDGATPENGAIASGDESSP